MNRIIVNLFYDDVSLYNRIRVWLIEKHVIKMNPFISIKEFNGIPVGTYFLYNSWGSLYGGGGYQRFKFYLYDGNKCGSFDTRIWASFIPKNKLKKDKEHFKMLPYVYDKYSDNFWENAKEVNTNE